MAARCAPSVLVSELLDYLDVAGGGSLVTRHRLQPFNAEYFQGKGNLFSYSTENCRASAAAETERVKPARFFSAPLPPPEEDGGG